MSALGSPADRKVVLMRRLARDEAKRLGIEPTPQQVVETTRWFRQRFDLLTVERLAAFLRFADLDLPRFSAMMTDFAALDRVLEHHTTAIDREVVDHLAIHRAYAFIGEETT